MDLHLKARGQTGIEYLLVIAAAIVFVAMVAYMLKSIMNSA
ncbi:MAG: hypothetical protein WC408_06930 [Candidatus Micrarchaeia archaeon]|jgi:uncharacterized protein (UPF0333 family)